jgi:hypothetical protein
MLQNDFRFSPVKCDVCYRFVVYVVHSSFLQAFIMKGCWLLLKAFSASVEMILWILFLILFICFIVLTDLYLLNCLCIAGMKTPNHSLCLCWVYFASIWFRNFPFMFTCGSFSKIQSLFLYYQSVYFAH